jgi:mono/diheme cytochrome c family protein
MAIVMTGTLLASAVRADEVNPNRAVYLKYCSACHGSDGKGDGVASGTMRPKPANLTLLAKKHGGKFPYVLVKDIIDGRKRIAAHGESDMPVWGEVFGEEKAATQPDTEIRGKVQQITDYLASIQAH